MVLPWASVIVIIVLLKLAFTCAMPEAIFLRSRRRTRVVSFPIQDSFRGCRADTISSSRVLLFLAGDRFGGPFAGARVGVRALAANREPAPMPQPAIATEVHQTFDVHRHFAPQITLDHV